MTDNNNKMSNYLDKIETDKTDTMSVDTKINLNFKLIDDSITEVCDKMDLTIVHELSLCFNKMSCIPSNFSQYLNNLEKLDLSNNNLEELPTSFGLLTKLRHLQMDNNKFQAMPIALAGIVRLKSLSMSHNSLGEISEELGSLTSLELLNLSFNKLSKFPMSFTFFHRLRELNIAGNKFDIIPGCITDGMRNLEILDLSLNTNIKLNVPPCSKRLIKFYATNNKLCRTFPRWLLTSAYSSIEEVNFNETEFFKFSFPKEKAFLNLRIASFNQSDLTDSLLEMLLQNMYRLEKLDIGNDCPNKRDGNTFCNVPCQILKNPQLLKEIDMKATGLPMLSRTIVSLTNITSIDFSHNNIAWLPDEFCLLTKLEVLIINNNTIISLPDNFGNLIALKELTIYGNHLSSLPDSMSNLGQLSLLDLYDNELMEIPWNVVNLEHLEAFDIDYNLYSTDELTIRNTPYENFRKSLRGKCVSFGKRTNEVKIVPQREEEEGRSINSSPGSSNSKLDYYDESDENAEEPGEMCSLEEEDWGLLEDSTDEYEPSFTSRKKYQVPTAPPYLHSQYFCPDDLHAQPIRQQVRQIFNDRRHTPRTFEEGQFDDAEI